jgi:hypothetical protein
MPTCFVAPVTVIAAALWCSVLLPAAVQAQESRSAASAKQLAQLLQEKKFDSIAAPHPGAPDMFVAALYFPGQLLVVWARYTAPTLLNEKITKGEYRDVYVDLNSASVPESRVLITDFGADGLKAKHEENQPFDQQDVRGKGIRFDGNWYDQKMSEEDYMKVYVEADRAYAEALDALIAQVKKGS